MIRRMSFAILLVLAGCVGHRRDLGPQWAPLRRLQEASWVADGMVTTIGGVAYTRDLSVLPDGLELDALLVHERVHAVDERSLGAQFYVDYTTFPRKRWEFESAAYSAELAFKRAHGLPIDVEWYAKITSERYYGMIGYDQALIWFQARK